MQSPWLGIPLAEYEAHMSLPAVGQAQMLAQQLAKLIAQHAPASVAVIGCAGGNGLEGLESTCVERIVAIDINPEYIAACRMRHAKRLAKLELHCADIESRRLQFAPVALIFAALIFEYADVAATLATLQRNLRPDGTLAALLQLAHTEQGAITPTVYRSLNALEGTFKLVAPSDLRAAASVAGFEIENSTRIDLPSGKQFLLQNVKLTRQ
jgi:trans-aconitate methyltransferase